MYLKRLELSGFKSFADKTELEFGHGITAVVGPNGSGKSNISDAMRWVLGEQSAKSLRGGKMDELIFAGSDARKPVNVAEVSLVLDNSTKQLPMETDEVTVTRRVRRDGEADYLINRQACRLKDIMELFMDTGLGKDAYSIIGQGKIEEILSSKAEERRGIFEEASGIIKFKTRKREAERKLADTQGNVQRLDDIIGELHDQIEPLRRQAKKAEQFKILKQQIKDVEVGLFVYQIEQLQTQWEQNRKLVAEKRELTAIAAAELSRVDAELESTRWELQQLEWTLDGLQANLLDASESLEKEEGSIEVIKTRLQHLQETRVLTEERLKQLEDEQSTLSAEEHKFQEKFEAIRGEMIEAKTTLQLEERQAELLASGNSANELEALQHQMFEAYQLQARARNEIRHIEQMNELFTRKNEQRDTSLTKTKLLFDERELTYQQLLNQIDTVERNLQAAKAEHAQISEQQQQLAHTYQERTQALQLWQQQLQAAKARLETLNELTSDFEGFTQGTKEILKATQRGVQLSGIRGAIAELIRVPQSYEVAVEIALGGALQNVVVEKEEDARKAIAYLKQRQAGRATFLPMSVIQGRSFSERDREVAKQINGWVGLASELIEYDSDYAQIISNLLGHVIVADTLEHANAIAAKLQHRFRIVTLDGDVVHAGGSMTGGSIQRKGSSILSRQRQIEELEAWIVTHESNIQTAKQELVQVESERTQIMSSVQKSEQLVAEINNQLQTLRIERKQAEHQLEQSRDQLDVLLDEQSGEQQSFTDRQSQLSEWQQQLEEALVKEKALQQALTDLEESRKKQEHDKDERNERLTQGKVIIARLQQEQVSVEDQLNRVRERLITVRRMIKSEQQAIQRIEDEKLQQETQLNGSSLRLVEWKEQKEEKTVQVELKRAERSDQYSKIQAHELSTKEQREQVKLMEHEVHRLDMSIARQEVELDTVLHKLSEEYELSVELAKTKYAIPEDVVASQQQVRDWKRQVQALGDVNMGAIEEFERVSERYEHMSGQRNDLMEAKQALEQIIHEINQEMGKRFMETFQAVRSHFVNVFRQLFGGGHADLILENPAAPLESGVEIVAQPPGKKLQNLQLLSGGERALTALALLFSILKVRPVPFCVLDEVEAALDEANVSRYASFLQAFSKTTQFIVVTHRRGTMESADILYGVTMEEGGVSKLVSVHLAELEQRMPESAIS